MRGRPIKRTLRVTADAAYDTIGFYEAAGARGATVVVPPTRTANVSRYGPRSSARDRTILAVKERGRQRWKQTSGIVKLRPQVAEYADDEPAAPAIADTDSPQKSSVTPSGSTTVSA